MKKKSILFVCTANICRSVMAEAILAARIAGQTQAASLTVQSAGVDVLVGARPDEKTIAVCRENGLDVRDHVARQLSKEMLSEADIVFCLSEQHRDLIAGAYPEFIAKTFLLREYGRSTPPANPSIPDPFGKPKRHYEECFSSIEEEVGRIADELMPPDDA